MSEPVADSGETAREFVCPHCGQAVAFVAAETAQTASSDQIALDDILSESDRLGRMVDQMLTLAEADAGQRTLLTSEVSLKELVDQAARSMRSLAETRGISLDTELPEDVAAALFILQHCQGHLPKEVLVTAAKTTPASTSG